MLLENQRQFLETLRQIMLEAGLESKLEGPTEDANFYTLIIRFGSIGADNTVVDFSLSFIPLPSQSSFCLIQFFCEIVTDVEAEAVHELMYLTHEINAKIPLGAFGYLPSQKICYFKHDYIMEPEFEDKSDLYLKMVEQQYSIFLGILNTFIDGIMQVVAGQSTAQQVLEVHQFAYLFK